MIERNSFIQINGGWKLLPFLLLVCPSCCLPDGDLCKWMNGRKYYIDVGESGIISAENVTSQIVNTSPSSADTSSNKDQQQIESSSQQQQPQIPQRCSVELITCPSCHFEMKTLRINIPTCSSDKTCRCDFVWIKEAAYSKSGQEFCGYSDGNSTGLEFESKTKLVSVDFLYSGAYTSAFALQFSAIKNVYVYKGGFEQFPNNSTGEISSPNFPGGYPSDYSAEYILQNVNPLGFVQLLFTDFQLSLWSYMEILDSNGSRIDVYNGNTFRPPALISSGPVMTVKFQANDEYPSSGFLASYAFVGYSERYWINRPSTECGGFVEDYGGAITMMNMVPSNMMRAFDCVWLIHPRNAHVPGKQISVRVSQFDDMGAKSTLSIRQGLYSKSPLLETVTPFHHHRLHRGQEYVVPATVGLYIRLVGFFNNKSHLAIIYSTFHYDNCYAIGDFECGNGRCVKNSLRCDGFNHCGDGTDESSCFGSQPGTPSPEDANWWRTLTPNYYFPKTDNGNNTGTNTLILVTSLAGLGMFVLTTVVILVKLHKQRQDDNISREILQTISADIEAENAAHHHRVPSDPPMYDPPPSYDDVIKFYLPPPPAYSSVGTNHGTNTSPGDRRADGNLKTRTRRKKPSRQSNSSHHEAQPAAILRVALPEENEEPQTVNEVPQNTSGAIAIHQSELPAVTSASSAGSQSERPNPRESNWKTIRKFATTSSSIKSLVPYKYQSSLVGGRQHQSRTPARNPATEVSLCECRGACSCSQNDRGVSDKADRKAVTADRATQSGFQLSENPVDTSRSSVVPNTNNELVPLSKPPRSRSFCDDNRNSSSSSKGPSEAKQRTKDGNCDVSANRGASLRRSSSGPSEIPHSAVTDDDDRKSESPNITQVKNLASAIFGGLQQSFTSRGSDSGGCSGSSSSSAQQRAPQSNGSDKCPAPNVWGSLWYSSRKKTVSDKDVSVHPTKECCCTPTSDTQPLIISPAKKSISGNQQGSGAAEESQRNRIET